MSVNALSATAPWPYRPLPIGIELDIDLSQALSDEEQEAFRSLFFEHSLILVRGQALSPDQHLRACSYLGPVPVGSATDPAVHVIETDGALGDGQLVFHSDLAFDRTPHVGVSLHALQIEPEEATSTDFVSGVRAAAELDPRLREEVSARSVVHVFPQSTAVRTVDRPSDEYPQACHPVLKAHPVTGREVLFVAEQTTTRFEGSSPEDSAPLLARLFSHLYEQEGIYRHRWRTGDILFWDNVALQHGRRAQTSVGKRVLQRVTIAPQTLNERYGEFLTSHAHLLTSVAHSASVNN